MKAEDTGGTHVPQAGAKNSVIHLSAEREQEGDLQAQPQTEKERRPVTQDRTEWEEILPLHHHIYELQGLMEKS
jgi:hypothetical protein